MIILILDLKHKTSSALERDIIECKYMDYLIQINRAIDYIENHLADDLIIDEISREAGISKWHFQRVFKAVVQETVKEYTLQRRLSLAAAEIVRSEKVFSVLL